jgi:histone H3/H4
MTEIRRGTLEKVLREETGFRVSFDAAAQLKVILDNQVAAIAVAAKENAQHAKRVTIEAADITLAASQIL